MRFGIFDQNDWQGGLVADQYSDRLKLAELYDAKGFYCYHMSEHHGTPLSTTPSPSVYLAALSQRTSTLRFGPLVYLLPGYNPLRLAEEIAMLDHLSHGRFEFGVGRGASPHEMGYLGVEAEQMKPMYTEALGILREALTTGVLNHSGDYWTYEGVEMSIRPFQKPLPPMWAALGSPDSTVWPAQNGVNIVVSVPAERARAVFARYIAERAAAGLAGGMPLMGLNRYVVIAGTEDEALAIARRAWSRFYASFITLWKRYGTTPPNHLPPELDDVVAAGVAVVGDPDTVRAELARQVNESGANFLSSNFIFGDIAFAEATRSVELFASEIMPSLKEVGASAHARLLEAA